MAIQGNSVIASEQSYGLLQRSLRQPGGGNFETIEVSLKNEILIVALPEIKDSIADIQR